MPWGAKNQENYDIMRLVLVNIWPALKNCSIWSSKYDELFNKLIKCFTGGLQLIQAIA